ncbi:major facilitator superfamily transporter [Colletotrichum orchidophilum]|uniref:Major facilitator superfamily transporter n=1 Tax=Colletotrichum orchidophilum TaxID=1209926 RepID=A0A1G4B2Q4_9PEZI|nr:major facilitator superfamily transporter [Colletotrichum orchidophilum]OHE95582.1 major facilitator superfamily transporter [Colletotrichum orchidophilum]
MPPIKSASGVPAARVSSNRILLLLMLMVFMMSFGASVVQGAITKYLRQVICRQHYGLPQEVPVVDRYCHIDAVEKQLEWTEIVLQVCQAAGGLFFAYPVGKMADSRGRRAALLLGTCLWLIFSGILITTIWTTSWGARWALSIVIGAGRTFVEIAILTMTSDTTNDQQRSTHFGFVVSSALSGLVVSNVIHRYTPRMDFEIPVLVGFVAVGLSTSLILAIPELLSAQHENYREEAPEILLANPPIRPLYRILSALISSRALPLPAIFGLITALARTSSSSLDLYYVASFNSPEAPKNASSTFRGDVVRYWTPVVGIFFISCVILPSVCGYHRRPSGDKVALRDYRCLVASTSILVLASIFVLCKGKLFSLGGILAAAVAATVPGLCCSLMLYGLGVAVRAKFAGRLFGIVATVQCAATLVLAPAIGLATRRSHANGMPTWLLFLISFVVFGVVLHSNAIWKIPTCERPVARGDEAGFELSDLGELEPAPPVYSAHQGDRPAPMPIIR